MSEAGALGSIGVGATDVAGARAMMSAVRECTNRALNVNLFVHGPASADPVRETEWLEWLRPLFADFGGSAPNSLRTIYRSFAEDADLLAMLVQVAPPAVSFHFGLPPADALSALRERGSLLLATATSLDEARAIEAAGYRRHWGHDIERAQIYATRRKPAQLAEQLGRTRPEPHHL